MKEYTILALLSVAAAVILDNAFKTRLLKKREFYLFLAAVFFFKLIVNGFLTAQNIVMYNPGFFMGVRLGSIPLEDFLFGFSMVTMALVFWEYFKQKEKGKGILEKK